MKKITGTQIVIGSILLYLLLRKRSAQTIPPTTTAKPAPMPKQDYAAAQKASAQQPANGLAGEWELNCYHQVI